MKKLIAMIGAVALSFGLFAEAPTTEELVPSGVSFEAGDPGLPGSQEEFPAEFVFADADGQWLVSGELTATAKPYGDETAPAHLGEIVGDQLNYLDIETDGAPLYRTFADASNIGTEYQGDPTNYVSAAGVYMDVNVKFTAGEEAPAVGDGTKLAVWAQVIEGDDATTTNLVVTCGQLSDEGIPTPANIVLDTSALTTDLVGAWHRVTILSMVDTDGTVPATYFLVYVDSKLMSAVDGGYTAFADGVDAADLVSAKYLKYAKGDAKNIGRSLFPSMVPYDEDFSKVLSMVGFQGAGQIDDLWLGEGSPFTMDVQVIGLTNADIVSLKANGEVVEGEAGLYTVPAGASLEIALKAKAGFLFADGTDTATVTVDAADEIDLSDEIDDATKAPFAIILAGQDPAYYNTFAAALDAAAAGATIQLCDDFNGLLAVTKGDFILDLNGNTVTSTTKAITIEEGASVVVTNGTVVSGNTAIRNSGTLVVEANTVVQGVEGAVSFFKHANTTINGGTFTSSDNAVLIGNGNTDNGPCTLVVNDGTFTGNIKSSGYIACGIYIPNAGTYTINGGTFTVNGGCGICARAGVTTVNGGTFNVTGDTTGGVGDKKVDVPCNTFFFDNSVPPYPGYNSETDGIFVPGTSTVKASKDFLAFVEEGYKTKLVDNYYVVTPETPFAIIIAGDPVTTNFYETLAEAVEEADANNYTITVLANVAIEKTEIAGKKIVLTADEAVTITGQLRAVDSADLTIGENITLTTDKHPALFVIGDKNNKGERTTAGTPTTVVIDGKVIGTNATFDETFAIAGNGNDVNGVNLTVNGEVSNANGTAIYWPNPGTLTVNGHVAGYSAIVIKDGALVVNDGAYIEATGTNYQALPLNRDGSSPTADAIVGGYYPLSYGYGVPTITVNGGMIKCVADGATSIQGYDHEETAAPADAKNNIAVSGGDFFGGLLVADYLAEGFTLGEISGSTGYASVAQSFAIEVVNAGNKGTLAIDGGATTVIAGNKISGTLTGVESGFTAFVFVDGVKVAVDSETGAFEGVANNSGVVMVAYAKNTAWYVDPFVKNVFNANHTSSGTQWAAMGESYNKVFISWGPSAGDCRISQFDVTALIDTFGEQTAEDKIAEGTTADMWARTYGISDKYRCIVSCNRSGTRGKLQMRKYDTFSKDNYIAINLEGGEDLELYPVTMNKASTYLYGTDRTKIYCFEISSENGADITGLKLVKSWIAPSWLETGLCVATINGKDIVYGNGKTNGQLLILDTSLNDEEGKQAAKFVENVGGTESYSLFVTGIDDGTPHLIVGDKTTTTVYALTADGCDVAMSPIEVVSNDLVFNETGYAGRNGIVGFDDETKIIAGVQGKSATFRVSVVEHKPANLIVRTIVDNGTSVTTNDEQVAFGAAASVPVTVPAGYDLTAVTVNGTAQEVVGNAFTFTSEKLEEYVLIRATEALQTFTVTFMNGDVEFAKSNNVAYGTTVAAPTEKPTSDEGTFKAWMLNEVEYDFATPVTTDLTLTAAFEAAGIEPGEEKTVEGDTPEEALENAKKIPIVLTEEEEKAGMTTTYLVNNVKSNGQGGFVAFVDVNKAAIEAVTGPIGIDSTAEEPLKVDADNVTAKVKTVPGVWYGMDEAAELSATEFDPVVSTYTIGDGTTKTFTIPKKANATKAFYKVGVRVIKPTAE